MADLQKLLDIMERLRAENGCPWDREQTSQTLTPYLVEETYEVIEAIGENSPPKIKEELGDLLFQIVFHCQIAKERGAFDIQDVIDTVSEKLTRRHPHVFGDAKFETPEQVLKQWEDRKKEEGKNRESILEGVPKELPSLLRAHRIQSRASRVGFDWNNIDGVMDKLDEELSEFRDALQQKDAAAIEEELGDIFFALVNISRFVRVNPEEALRKTIIKFISRFRFMEVKAAGMGRQLADMTPQELDDLWEEAKKG